MTAVATPPNFAHINKSAWNANPQSALNSMNADDVARMFVAPRKSVQRSNSSSSVSSASSASSTSTVSQSYPNMSPAAEDGPAKRKKSLRPGGWSSTKDDSALGSSATSIRAGQINGIAGSSVLTAMLPAPVVPSQHAQNGTQQQNGHRGMAAGATEGNPVLYLLSMNGTFERKTISVPYYPDSIRIGRQTNAKTAPTATNGFFDSKVLSRQHAEIWADRNGKVWIRDVKSSNGTFVNSFRLSAENKDSDPHELQTQDQLELGIDIVSEDQKTVVHHKVAAKVEHAGYLGSSNNVLDMNFGDLDPANGGLLLNHAGLTQRGRTGSQGSVGSRGTSVAASQMSMASHRPMSYWLSPVTTEQIAKRIAHEMRAARLQASDLGHADMFFGSLLSNDAIKAQAKPIVEAPKPNGILFRTDSRTRFSDPPAPPPQQPLPEKPDVSRSLGFETSLPAQKRSLDRPQSLPSISPLPAESSSQIVSLVEALATAKKECEAQSARMRDLEEMLAQERQARAAAEELARMLESRSSESSDSEGLVSGAVTEMPRENHQTDGPLDTLTPMMDIDANAITKSTLEMEQRIEDMVSEMRDMKVQMDQFRLRAETAESERDANKKTLAQMVESIRLQESTRSMSAHKPEATTHIDNMPERGISPHDSSLLEKIGLANGHVHTPAVEPKGTLHFPLTGTLARSRDGRDALASQSAPYASAIGIVLIGMGLMAYLNGWQSPKVER